LLLHLYIIYRICHSCTKNHYYSLYRVVTERKSYYEITAKLIKPYLHTQVHVDHVYQTVKHTAKKYVVITMVRNLHEKKLCIAGV